MPISHKQGVDGVYILHFHTNNLHLSNQVGLRVLLFTLKRFSAFSMPSLSTHVPFTFPCRPRA